MIETKRARWGSRSAWLQIAVVCLLPALLATCGEDGPAGPSGPVPGRVEFAAGPILSGGFFGPNLPIDRVHVLIVRPPNGVVKDTTRGFDPNQNQLRMDLPILLRAAAESLDVTLELLNGTSVLFSGTSRLEATAGPPSSTPPPAIPLTYIGPGSQIAQLLLAPLDSTVGETDSLIMRVAGLDAGQAPVPAFYASWGSSDPAVATVNGAGVVRALVPRGTVYVRARTPATLQFPTGIVESTTVTIVPRTASLVKVAGDSQTAPVNTRLPQLLEVEVRAADNLPIEGVPVAFATLSPGATVDSAIAITGPTGIARTGVVLGTTVGAQHFTATAAGAPLVAFLATATATPAPTWTGAVSTDWNDPANWNLNAVPGAGDSVTVPSGTPNQPSLTSNIALAALLNDGTITAGAFAVSLGGNLRGNGSIVGTGNLVMVAPAALLDQGAIPNLVVQGTSVVLGRRTSVAGDITVTATGGNLTLGGHTAIATGDLNVVLAGTLTMTNPIDTLRIPGDVFFNGNSTSGMISSGVSFIGGNFTQAAGSSSQSYAPTGNHIDVFNGGGIQTVTFQTPGASQSNFETLVLANPAGGVTIGSNIFQSGPVAFAAGVPRIVHGSGQTVFVAELLASNATLDNVLVVSNNVQITQFDSISFINYSPAATPLTISHPGGAAPFEFRNLSFGVTPTTGFYLSVTDNAADANTLTLNLTNPVPATPSGLVQTAGGAVVNWPFVPAGARTWTGAASTDWFTPGNWSPAVVPGPSDDVVIPATAQQPVISGAVAVRDLTIQAGATLTSGFDVTASGNVSVSGSFIGGTIVMVTNGTTVAGNLAALRVVLPTRFETVSAAGALSVNGLLDVGRGHFQVGAQAVTAGTFQTTGEGMLAMNNAAGNLVVTGDATFGGEDPTGVLTAGTIRVRGNFAQLTGVTQGSFIATGTNRVVLDGTGRQQVSFANPGAAASRFQELVIANTTDTVFFLSNASVSGQLSEQSGSPITLGGNGSVLGVGGVAMSGVDWSNLSLDLGAGLVTQFDNVAWTGFPSTAVPFRVTRPSGTLSFANHQFTTTPTSGFYLRAEDTNPADGQTLTIDMTTPTPATPGGFVQTVGGAVVNWPAGPAPAVIWTGAVSTDWQAAGNWSSGVVPTFTDSVEIPAGGNQPVLSAPSVTGPLHLANGTLTLNGQSLVVSGNFYSTGSGRLVMTNAQDGVSIAGNAIFNGASQLGFMSAGAIILSGDLIQLATNSPDSYHPSGTHVTFFSGGGNQSISFATPGLVPGSSHLQEVAWNGTGSLTLASNVDAHGTFTRSSSTGGTIAGSGAVLTVGGFVSTLGTTTLSNVTLVIDQATPTGLSVNNLSFVNQAPAAVQLEVRHPGVSGAIPFTNLAFSTVPTTGFYLRAVDLNTGDGLPFTVDMVNPTPASDGGFSQVVGGAVINWPAAGGGATGTWNGGADDNWNNPANWVGNQVPNAGDDIIIPAGAPTYPALISSEIVGDMVVEPGALVDFVDGFLEITGDLTGGGSMTNGGPQMSGIGKIIQMAGLGSLVTTGDITLQANLLITSGDLLIQGAGAKFDVNGFTLDIANGLVLTADGTMQMTNPTGSVSVGGSAFFDGGSETGLLTAGTLAVQGDFTQASTTSNTSFAASGSHETVLGGGATQVVSFATPGGGGTGSHFNALDVTAATGGVSLASDIVLDSALISSSAGAAIVGNGNTVTARRWLVTGLTVTNAPMILDEQTVPTTESFSNVTFGGFPTSGTTMMTVLGLGNSFTPRPAVTTTNVNFQTLAVGAGNLYVKLTSTNGQSFTMNMTGSNQSPQVAGNGPALSDPANQQTVAGARINWP